ncbi:hypothetical protein McanCB49686_007527 [Microsporum canis]
MFTESMSNEAFASKDFFIYAEADCKGESSVRLGDFSGLSKSISTDENVPQYFHCLDLLTNIAPVSRDGILQVEDGSITDGSSPRATGTALEHLVQTCYKIRGIPAQQGLCVVTKLILVTRSGYLCRNDILELRMRHSEFIESVIPLSAAGGYIPLVEPLGETHLLALFTSSPGALLVDEKPTTPSHEMVKSLDQDLQARPSFDWVLQTKPQARKVAMVGGRAMYDPKKMSFCSQGALEAAQALGISVVVVDKPGHWLQDETYSCLQDEFVAIDTTIDEGLPSRIAEAVRDMGIDGITTFTDDFLDATVRAAEKLSLSTEPTLAYAQSLNKYVTRKLASPNAQALRLDNAG